MLLIALFAYIAAEFVQLKLQKEILHLTLFSMFLLVSNYLVNIGKYDAVLAGEERAQSLFFLAMFALAAAMFELVDLGLDQVLKVIDTTSTQVLRMSILTAEALIGIAAILMIYFVLDRLLVFLRSLSAELKDIKLP